MVHLQHPYHPDITDDMWDKIDQVIQANKDVSGSVITVLRECQSIAGYLPVELIDHVSRGLTLPRSRVFGVATFYSFFSLAPKGRNVIKVCMGTACYVKGIKDAIERIGIEYQLKDGGTTEDRRFSMEAVRCVGACGLAPVMVVNADIHGMISGDKAIRVLDDYK